MLSGDSLVMAGGAVSLSLCLFSLCYLMGVSISESEPYVREDGLLCTQFVPLALEIEVQKALKASLVLCSPKSSPPQLAFMLVQCSVPYQQVLCSSLHTWDIIKSTSQATPPLSTCGCTPFIM